MSEENKTKETKNSTTKNDSKREKIVFGIVFIFVILFIVLLIFMKDGTKKESSKNTNSNITVDNHFNYDYEYVLETYFGQIYYIYLLKDGSVKVVSKSPVYEVCENTDCLEPTGEIAYEEETLNFSDKSMEKVRNFITSFFDKKLTNYINLESLELNREQKRMELAILLNSEDDITFEDNLNFQTNSKQIKNSSGKVIFENKKTTIVDSSNQIVQKIGQYLNAIVDEKWQQINEECLELLKEGIVADENEIFGIEYGLNLEDIGVFNYSFTYSMSGSVGGVPWADFKGYVFSSTGELAEIPNGLKSEIYDSAIEEFKKSEDYKNNQEDFMANWSDILKENMFNPGYWYFKGDKIIFTFPKSLISEDGPSYAILKIEIENTVLDL